MSENRQEIILVTGASRGMGRQLCKQFVAHGKTVYGFARSASDLISLEKELGAAFIPFTGDVTKPEDVDSLFGIIDDAGQIPATLINNAGVGVFKHMEDLLLDDWQLMIDTNLTGTFLMTQAAVRRMKLQQAGTIVNIVSVAGKEVFRNGSGYTASKFGLDGFTKVIREELRKFRIRVIAVYPGVVDSTWWDAIRGSDSLPRHKMLKPDAVVAAIIHALEQPADTVIEELIIRNIAGKY